MVYYEITNAKWGKKPRPTGTKPEDFPNGVESEYGTTGYLSNFHSGSVTYVPEKSSAKRFYKDQEKEAEEVMKRFNYTYKKHGTPSDKEKEVVMEKDKSNTEKTKKKTVSRKKGK